MLHSSSYAKLLQRFIESLKDSMDIEIRYKIFIKLDFSIEAKLFIGLKNPDFKIPSFLDEENIEEFYDKFRDFILHQINNAEEEEIFSNEINVLTNQNSKEEFKKENIFIPEISLRIEQIEEADSYVNRYLFANGKGDDIEFGGRYRLQSLLEENKKVTNLAWGGIPVVTFYSYKGGMGRTTTMMEYAIFLAKQGKRVAVVDCDLEAPGYLNFFNLSNQWEMKEGKRNGLVEYLSDFSFVDSQDEFLNINNYVVIPDIESQGKMAEHLSNIVIVPGGNLNDPIDFDKDNKDKVILEEEDIERVKNARKDYIEGLSRLNISNPAVMHEGMTSIFKKLKEDQKVDIILVDSRTGFNDLFGSIALSMSDYVVGLFSFSDQTVPGIRQLAVAYANPYTDFKMSLVFNLLPVNATDSWINNGVNKINEILSQEIHSEEKPLPDIYLMKRIADLERLGTGDKTSDVKLLEVVEEVSENKDGNALLEFGEIGLLFKDITETVLPKNGEAIEDAINVDQGSDELTIDETPESFSMPSLKPVEIQKKLLKYTKAQLNKVHLFGEDQEIDPKTFYFRECMAQFFNPSKYIILGSKGSGKSMLYKTLSLPGEAAEETRKLLIDFSKIIAKRRDLDDVILDSKDYICIDTISLKRDIDFNKIFEELPKSSHKIFWMIYTWNAIMSDPHFTGDPDFTPIIEKSGNKDSIIPREILRNQGNTASDILVESTKKGFRFLGNIEKDFIEVNKYLATKGKQLFVLYDGLDNINPKSWTVTVSPLVDFWRDQFDRYSNIAPKLFIRTDLFPYLEGTNTLRLKEASFNIDWTIEEVFGFFFKLILTDETRDYFWQIFKKIDKENSFAQVKNNWDNKFGQMLIPEKTVMVHLVMAYFGKKNEHARDQKIWDFFIQTLSNANGGVSLRPFINLLINEENKPINGAIQDPETHITAILPSKYYATQENRDLVANGYFNDMTRGDGFTADIIKVRDFLRGPEGREFMYKELNEAQYFKLLNLVLENYSHENLNSRSAQELSNQLIAAGIIALIPGRNKIYKFAPMFIYSWGLRNPEKWDKGMIVVSSKTGRYVVRTLEGKNISFDLNVDITQARYNKKIEYKTDGEYPNLKVVKWRPLGH